MASEVGSGLEGRQWPRRSAVASEVSSGLDKTRQNLANLANMELGNLGNLGILGNLGNLGKMI